MLIITPNSGDAYTDFITEIKCSKSLYSMHKCSVNLLSKENILKTLEDVRLNKNYNIMVIIRGGGSSNEFNIFDDIEICEKVAAINCHKIIGLGRSSNRTLLELVSDAVLQTPTAAGRYINENINNHVKYKKSLIKDLENKLEKDIKFYKNSTVVFSVISVISMLFLFYSFR